MDLYEVVMKLVGPVKPVGESWEDSRRFENMVTLTDLTEQLLSRISAIAHNADREEASMKAIGKHARDFMKSVSEWSE